MHLLQSPLFCRLREHNPGLNFQEHEYTELPLLHCCLLHLACFLAESFYFVALSSQLSAVSNYKLYFISKRAAQSSSLKADGLFYFTFSITSTNLQRFNLLIGLVSIIFTMSPMLHSFFSS